jgi:hypothetical protein
LLIVYALHQGYSGSDGRPAPEHTTDAQRPAYRLYSLIHELKTEVPSLIHFIDIESEAIVLNRQLGNALEFARQADLNSMGGRVARTIDECLPCDLHDHHAHSICAVDVHEAELDTRTTLLFELIGMTPNRSRNVSDHGP